MICRRLTKGFVCQCLRKIRRIEESWFNPRLYRVNLKYLGNHEYLGPCFLPRANCEVPGPSDSPTCNAGSDSLKYANCYPCPKICGNPCSCANSYQKLNRSQVSSPSRFRLPYVCEQLPMPRALGSPCSCAVPTSSKLPTPNRNLLVPKYEYAYKGQVQENLLARFQVSTAHSPRSFEPPSLPQHIQHGLLQ